MSTPLRVDPTRGLVRGVRAAVLTVPIVAGAVLAHATADGCADLLAVVAALGLCWPAAVALLGARRSLGALVLWVAGTQVVTHVLLEWVCGEGGGHASLAQHLLSSLDGTMIATHLIAVVVTSVLLGRADAGLWTADALLSSASRLLGLPTPLPAQVTPVVLAHLRRPDAVPPLHPLWETAPLQRRGPPGCALAQRASRPCCLRRRPGLSSGPPSLELSCAPPVLLPFS